MARYIDAEPYKDCKIVLHDEDEGVLVKDIPDADVQEVRHGKWVYHYRLKKFVCLECGYEAKHKPDFNYCPNCGAKMDKE